MRTIKISALSLIIAIIAFSASAFINAKPTKHNNTVVGKGFAVVELCALSPRWDAGILPREQTYTRVDPAGLIRRIPLHATGALSCAVSSRIVQHL